MRTHWRNLATAAATAVVATALATIPGDTARADTELGKLVCKRIPGTGFNLLIHSKYQVRCIFNGSVDAEQWYIGETGVLLGVDLKWNKEESIYFGILSNTVKFVPEGDFLSGKYAGAKADAALGIGGGAAILLGGNEDTIALNPAVSAGKGAGVAAGLSYLDLQPDPLNKARIVNPRGELVDLALYANYFDAAYKYYHRSEYGASDHFSDKSITAASGKAPAPDAVSDKLTPAQQQQATAARKRVVTAVADPTGKAIDAAKAQVNYDCWLHEMSAGGSAKNVSACRDAMNNHLKTVETAVARKLTKNVLMEPTWFRAVFDTDSAELGKFGLRIVDDARARIAQLSAGKVYVMGNTDRSGSTKYNLKLSQKRADVVRAALTASGVPEKWISPIAYGEHNPLSTSDNPHNALNRRVDILVEPITVKPEVVKEQADKAMRKQ